MQGLTQIKDFFIRPRFATARSSGGGKHQAARRTRQRLALGSSSKKWGKKLGVGSTMVLYMSFDKFILAVESRDLSQADKSIIRMSSFPKAVFE